MRKVLLDCTDDMAPDLRRDELRLKAAEAGDAAVDEPTQPLDPPVCDLLRDDRIIEPGVGGVWLP